MMQSPPRRFEEILTIQEILQKVGNNHRYQLRLWINFFLVFTFSAFIQMGFPIIFKPAQFICDPGVDCSEEAVCARKTGFQVSSEFKSVAYSFELYCQRKKILQTCFHAFLYGGFIGSLYFGEVLERKGRKHAVVQSLAMMVGGLALSFLSGTPVLFSIGVFFFNAGFRGFYNASLLLLSEATNQITRAGAPMVFSIGWAVGQIIIALIGIIVGNWRIIFFLTFVPLGVLLYFAIQNAKQSPRFLITKHEYEQAKNVLAEISYINGKKFQNYQLKQEHEYRQKMQGYRDLLSGGNISSKQRHHSYYSLIKFDSVRIRIIIVGTIWSIISLSYFMSASNKLNSQRSLAFNVAFAGIIQIMAYFFSIVTSLNYGRIFVIKRLILASACVHLLFFFINPQTKFQGLMFAFVMFLDIMIRILMSIGNTFLAIYSIELFPTQIRHFALGILGFITKLMYMLSFSFDDFFRERYINPNFILGLFFVGSYFLTVKLRQTKQQGFKDNLSEDGNNLLMNETVADIF